MKFKKFKFFDVKKITLHALALHIGAKATAELGGLVQPYKIFNLLSNKILMF